MLTNENVQAKFNEAIAVLQKISSNQKNAESETILTMLLLMKNYSSSRNGIPSLRGQGLTDALALADEIIVSGWRHVKINTKALASSFTH